MGMTLKTNYHLIDLDFAPYGIEPSFYERVLWFYEEIALESNMTPYVEAIEERLFYKAVDSFGPRTGAERAEQVRDYIDRLGPGVRRDIERCLRRAALCYLNSEFYTEEGNSVLVANTPQLKLFHVKDIYGNKD